MPGENLNSCAFVFIVAADSWRLTFPSHARPIDLFSFTLSLLVGLLFGILPANRLNPTEALRYG